MATIVLEPSVDLINPLFARPQRCSGLRLHDDTRVFLRRSDSHRMGTIPIM